MIRKITLMTFVPLIILVILISGCAEKEIVEEPKELTPMTVQLKWVHQAQFAGNYVAKEKGFYAENGIDLTEMNPFDYVNFPIDRVKNKEVDFAITGGDELILAKDNGRAEGVKAVAVIYKTNPVCLYSLKESGIIKPQDLIGKTVGIERAADGTEINVGILYQAMMNNLELDLNEVNDVTIGYDATELLAGETDVSSGYVINEPHQAIEAGKEINIIMPAEYGVNMYADVLIAHEDTIAENSELVKAFVDATLQGWQYAIENQEEAVDITLKYARGRTRSHEAYMLAQSVPLIHLGDSTLGLMEEMEWQNAIDVLKDSKLLDNGVALEDLYTNEFVEDQGERFT